MKLVTVLSFLQSHDRDVLDLQEDPEAYIGEIEAELTHTYPDSWVLRNGVIVFPECVLRDHLGTIMETAKWETTATQK